VEVDGKLVVSHTQAVPSLSAPFLLWGTNNPSTRSRSELWSKAPRHFSADGEPDSARTVTFVLKFHLRNARIIR
jgi:hypothetical protein